MGLRDAEAELLRTVVQHQLPCLGYLVDKAVVGTISPEERDALSDLIMREFTGELREDYEPTQRGVLLDDLVDALEQVCPEQDVELNEDEVSRLLGCGDETP